MSLNFGSVFLTNGSLPNPGPYKPTEKKQESAVSGLMNQVVEGFTNSSRELKQHHNVTVKDIGEFKDKLYKAAEPIIGVITELSLETGKQGVELIRRPSQERLENNVGLMRVANEYIESQRNAFEVLEKIITKIARNQLELSKEMFDQEAELNLSRLEVLSKGLAVCREQQKFEREEYLKERKFELEEYTQQVRLWVESEDAGSQRKLKEEDQKHHQEMGVKNFKLQEKTQNDSVKLDFAKIDAQVKIESERTKANLTWKKCEVAASVVNNAVTAGATLAKPKPSCAIL